MCACNIRFIVIPLSLTHSRTVGSIHCSNNIITRGGRLSHKCARECADKCIFVFGCHLSSSPAPHPVTQNSHKSGQLLCTFCDKRHRIHTPTYTHTHGVHLNLRPRKPTLNIHTHTHTREHVRLAHMTMPLQIVYVIWTVPIVYTMFSTAIAARIRADRQYIADTHIGGSVEKPTRNKKKLHYSVAHGDWTHASHEKKPVIPAGCSDASARPAGRLE